MSTEWSSNGLCPDCGHSLIITERICAPIIDDGNEIHNGICPNCRKQYTVTSTETLTVNTEAAEQQDRIDALEARVARLEAIVQKLLDTQRAPNHPPITQAKQEETHDEQDATLRARYKYLF